MSDQTLKLAQHLLPHLNLLRHLQDLKTLAALSPMLKPPVRAALVSPTQITLIGSDIAAAPMTEAQTQTCHRLLGQFKGHDSPEYALTNTELRAALNTERERLLGSSETADLTSSLKLIATTLNVTDAGFPAEAPADHLPESTTQSSPEAKQDDLPGGAEPLASEPLQDSASTEVGTGEIGTGEIGASEVSPSEHEAGTLNLSETEAGKPDVSGAADVKPLRREALDNQPESSEQATAPTPRQRRK